MIDIPSPAIRHIQFIILRIWPVNVLTLLARGHVWSWGALVSLSIAILTELGVRMFFALAERRRRIEEAREEGRKEGRKEVRRETNEILMVLNAAARTDPDSLPSLLQQYQEQYQNGATSNK